MQYINIFFRDKGINKKEISGFLFHHIGIKMMDEQKWILQSHRVFFCSK
jgi:hypothetical protein